MKLFLIDAYALIYRSYYAFIKNPRINSKGMNTSAIFGFINSLEDVLKRETPTHIAVGFDRKVRLSATKPTNSTRRNGKRRRKISASRSLSSKIS